MPKADLEQFFKDHGKWNYDANRPDPDANHLLYPEPGKYAGPVPDYDLAAQVKAEANKIPLTEEAWKNANRIANGHAGTSEMKPAGSWTAADLEEWQKSFTPRVDALGLIVQYHTYNGEIHIIQHGGSPLYIFRDAMSAENWVRRELEAKAIRDAEAERVAKNPPVVITQSVDFSPAAKPVSRDEFNDLLRQFGVIAAQQATIIEMLGRNTSTRHSGDDRQFGIEG